MASILCVDEIHSLIPLWIPTNRGFNHGFTSWCERISPSSTIYTSLFYGGCVWVFPWKVHKRPWAQCPRETARARARMIATIACAGAQARFFRPRGSLWFPPRRLIEKVTYRVACFAGTLFSGSLKRSRKENHNFGPKTKHPCVNPWPVWTLAGMSFQN